MKVLPVLEFIWGKIAYFWSFLFTIETPFSMSLGALMFGCLVFGIVINFLVLILIPRTSDVVEGGNIYRWAKIKSQREAQLMNKKDKRKRR